MEKNIGRFFWVLLIFLVFFSLGTDVPNEQRKGFFSDESSYFSITQSLAHDLDIKYKREDIVRIKERFPEGPVGLYLKKGKGGEITYAKPFIYPLFAAPFFRLLDTRGIFLFNGLMLFLSVWMGYRLLRKFHPPGQSLSFTLIFFFTTVTWIYLLWMTSDLFNFFILFASLFFFFYPFKNSRWFYLSGLFFPLYVLTKPTNLAAVGVLFLILLFKKQWKRFIVLSLICLVVLMGFVLFYYQQTGELNFKLYYGGERTAFFGQFPYETPQYDFVSSVKTSADDYFQRFYITPEISLLNLYYYLFGRFTGMFIYFFIACFILVAFAWQQKELQDWFILGAIAVSILVACILFAADSYFGGSGSLGNRYFLNIFPLFFFLGFKKRHFRFLLVPILAAAIFLSPTFMDALFHSFRPRMTGISFPVKCFPVEKTQYMHLPTNENPRGRNRDIGGQAFLYFINDNSHLLEGDSFWSVGEKEVEVLLLTAQRVKQFEITLQNHPRKNRARVRIEHETQEVGIGPGLKKRLVFEHIRGLVVARGYLYHLKVKSARAYCAYFEEKNSEDKRWLGINIQIEPVY